MREYRTDRCRRLPCRRAAHIWERWLPKQFHDRAPRLVKDEEGGDARGVRVRAVRSCTSASSRRRACASRTSSGRATPTSTVRQRGCWEGKARLEDMDFDGVDAEFIYPSQRTIVLTSWATPTASSTARACAP